MKIYGQNFSDVFAKLPWPYKAVVMAGSAFVLFTLVYVPTHIFSKREKTPASEPLQISGDPSPSGNMDPSVAYDPAAKTVWMAYSSEETSPDNPAEKLIRVHLASAAAGKCDDWFRGAEGFEVRADDLLAADGTTVLKNGVWRAETPSLVRDPDDTGKEWKLYAYKYFWANDVALAQRYGIIVYKYAPNPAGPWSQEQWLFSPAPDSPPPPYDHMVLLQLSRLSPDLGDITSFSRPSVISKDGALIMTLSAFTGGPTPDRIVMLASLDHGNSWRYVGAPLKKQDLAGIGPYTVLAGASLIEQDGQVYLAAALGDERQFGQGSFIFSFSDLANGLLRRDPQTGALALLRHEPLHIPAAGRIGGGFTAYTDACTHGMLMGEQSSGSQGFQIYKTYAPPVGRAPAKTK